MTIKLHHVKNVDLMYGQGNGSGYWREPVDPASTKEAVHDLAQASSAMQQWVARNGLGCGNIARDCGEVRLGTKRIAYVGYNGRVWEDREHTKEIKIA